MERRARRAASKPIPALFDAMDAVLERQAKQIAIPRRFEATIKEIWSLQPRFEQRSGQRPYRLLEHPRFRAGWDFLDLRCQSGELEGDLAELRRLVGALRRRRPRRARGDAHARTTAPKKRRRSRGRGRKRGDGGDAPAAGHDEPPAA